MRVALLVVLVLPALAVAQDAPLTLEQAMADPDWSGLGWITLVTLLLLAVGFAGFRRRDLAR